MHIADLLAVLDAISPLRCAEPWDNVGLIAGDASAPLGGPTLLTIDLTREVVREAVALGAGAVVSYHPALFEQGRRLTADHPRHAVVLEALRHGMALLSPHTALDATPGGVTDWLCDCLAPDGHDSAAARTFGDRRAIRPYESLEPSQTHKVATFVPADAADRVRDALASIGAGVIGLYEQCSFSAGGTGTFRGGEGSNPVVGQAGRLERAPEVRLEMVCPKSALPLAREVLRQFHPYEEPAWDVYALAPKPDRAVGAGRRLTLDRPAPPRELAGRLKRRLGVDAVKLAASGDAPVARVGVVPGAGGSLLDAAIADGCTMFVTGEMRYHACLGAVERGCSVLLAGHTNTERGYLPRYAERINAAAPGAGAVVSQADGPIFRTL